MAECYFQGKHDLLHYLSVNLFSLPPRSSLVYKTTRDNQRKDNFADFKVKKKF